MDPGAKDASPNLDLGAKICHRELVAKNTDLDPWAKNANLNLDLRAKNRIKIQRQNKKNPDPGKNTEKRNKIEKVIKALRDT